MCGVALCIAECGQSAQVGLRGSVRLAEAGDLEGSDLPDGASLPQMALGSQGQPGLGSAGRKSDSPSWRLVGCDERPREPVLSSLVP